MPRKVLVVDEAETRTHVARELGEDFVVIEASSVRDALAAAAAHPDLAAVVSAFRLGPGPRGTALLDAVHEYAPMCARVLLADQADLVDDTSIEMFARPWPEGTLRRHLLALRRHDLRRTCGAIAKGNAS